MGVFKFFLQDRIQRFEKKTVEIQQPQIIEKIDETPEIQTAQEHSAVLAQLAPRLSGIMMKVGAGAGEDSFVKVKGLITRLIDKPYCDEETSTAAEKEDLEADTAKHSSTLETAVFRYATLDGKISTLQSELGVLSKRQLHIDTMRANEDQAFAESATRSPT